MIRYAFSLDDKFLWDQLVDFTISVRRFGQMEFIIYLCSIIDCFYIDERK